MTRTRARIALAAAALTALSIAIARAPTWDRFTLVLLPDTQRYYADGREFLHFTPAWRAADYALEWALVVRAAPR